MIRLVYCVNRREDVSIEDFRRFWVDRRFSELFREYGSIFGTARIKKNLVLKVPMNLAISERQGMRKPYDGIIEIWWDSAKELIAINETDQARELMWKIAEYEDQFVDKARSTIFFTEYREED
jgi:hypothetical protein